MIFRPLAVSIMDQLGVDKVGGLGQGNSMRKGTGEPHTQIDTNTHTQKTGQTKHTRSGCVIERKKKKKKASIHTSVCIAHVYVNRSKYEVLDQLFLN